MRSLRWRIATWYALLLVVVVVVLGLTVAIRFDRILLDQERAHLDNTVNEMALAAVPPPNLFALGDPTASSLESLLSSANLENWASPTTFIEVDTVQGYPLAHSSNLGPNRFPPEEGLTPKNPRDFRDVQMPTGAFLVEDRLLMSGDQSVVVRVGEPLDQLRQAFRETRQATIVILIIAVLAVVGLSIVLAGQATNPINELARAMREIGSERLHRRLKWKNRQDEVGRLAETFDDLLARLEEAFARERQFISDASHELKTPLTSINANAQMLVRWGDRDAAVLHESLETIVAESAALGNMVTGMLTLAKADSGDAIPKEPIALNDAASEAVRGAHQAAAEKGLSLAFEPCDPSPVILGDASLIRQLLRNLIENAVKFTQVGGITVRVGSSERSGCIEVQDTGFGIDPDDLPFIFDRFYRADKSRSRDVGGTGLGLAIVRSIARVHDGSIEAEPQALGSLFRVRFPRLTIPDANGQNSLSNSHGTSPRTGIQ